MNGLWPLAPGARGKSLEDSKGTVWPFINDIQATRYVVVVQVEKVSSARERGKYIHTYIYIYMNIQHTYIYYTAERLALFQEARDFAFPVNMNCFMHQVDIDLLRRFTSNDRDTLPQEAIRNWGWSSADVKWRDFSIWAKSNLLSQVKRS